MSQQPLLLCAPHLEKPLVVFIHSVHSHHGVISLHTPVKENLVVKGRTQMYRMVNTLECTLKKEISCLWRHYQYIKEGSDRTMAVHTQANEARRMVFKKSRHPKVVGRPPPDKRGNLSMGFDHPREICTEQCLEGKDEDLE